MSQLTMALEVAMDSKRKYEDETNEFSKKAYDVARGSFRSMLITAMDAEMKRHMKMYLELAADVSVVYERIHSMEQWFRRNGQTSNLKSNFLKDVKLPDPIVGCTNSFCGTQADTPVAQNHLAYLVGSEMVELAEAVFDDHYFYHNDHERYPQPPGAPTKNKVKEFNAALGR
jgi:hypothetical protein